MIQYFTLNVIVKFTFSELLQCFCLYSSLGVHRAQPALHYHQNSTNLYILKQTLMMKI